MVFLVVWVHKTIGWQSTFDMMARTRVIDVLIVVSGIMLSHILRTVRLIVCYRTLTANFAETAGIGLIHNCLNSWLPMRLGELALPILSKSNLGVGYKDSTLVLIYIRALDIHVLLLLVIYFLGGTLLSGGYLWLTIACLSLLPFVLLTQRFWASRLPVLARLQQVTGTARLCFLHYALTAAAWIAKLGTLSLLALRLSDIEFNHAWIATIFADSTSISPITGLANAGTFEAGFVFPLWLFGYNHAEALSVAITVHAMLILMSLIMGLLGALLLLFSSRRSGSFADTRKTI